MNRTQATALTTRVIAVVGLLSCLTARNLAQGPDAPRTVNVALVGIAGNWSDLSKGIETSLTNRLVHSRGLKLIERANLPPIFNEIRLNAQGILDENSKAAFGQLASVNDLVYGAVTSFDSKSSQVRNLFGHGYSTSYSADITVSLRITDVQTGAVVTEKKLSFCGYGNDQSQANNQATATLGEALAQFVIASIVHLPDVSIVKLDESDHSVWISTGASSQVQPGERFEIDEVTSVKLDNNDTVKTFKKIAELKVTEVTDAYSKCEVGHFVHAFLGNSWHRDDNLFQELKKSRDKGNALIARGIALQ